MTVFEITAAERGAQEQVWDLDMIMSHTVGVPVGPLLQWAANRWRAPGSRCSRDTQTHTRTGKAPCLFPCTLSPSLSPLSLSPIPLSPSLAPTPMDRHICSQRLTCNCQNMRNEMGALAWPGFLRERAEGREGKQRDLCLPLAYSATINNQKGTSEC